MVVDNSMEYSEVPGTNNLLEKVQTEKIRPFIITKPRTVLYGSAWW